MNPSRNPRSTSRVARAVVITAAVVVALAVAAIIYTIVDSRNSPPPSLDLSGANATEPLPVVDASSHVLDDGGDQAVEIVEFLDFECEACGAFYPVVEDIREKHAGEITYVVRYFPLPGHFNSTNAALAAEAAAQQGQLEAMYARLFETQAEWGEAQESRADVFRGFAEEIGLDMTAYDAAIADPATLERVEFDFAAGEQLGVDSTPTFFVEGRQVDLRSLTDLDESVDAALGGSE